MSGLGISFPILKNPANLFKMLFGQAVDLIVWDIPGWTRIRVQPIFGPILPPVPLFVTIGGSFNAFADFYVGLDTPRHQGEGISSRASSSATATRPRPTGRTARAGRLRRDHRRGRTQRGRRLGRGRGRYPRRRDRQLQRPNDDGKVYLDELLDNARDSLFCIFDIAGRLSAFLEAFIKVGVDTPFGFVTLFDERLKLADVTLLDFNHSCEPLPPPVLAHVEPDGQLVLHIGPQRQPCSRGRKDTAETLELLPGANPNRDHRQGLRPGADVRQRVEHLRQRRQRGRHDHARPGHHAGGRVARRRGERRTHGGSGNDTITGGSGDDSSRAVRATTQSRATGKG